MSVICLLAVGWLLATLLPVNAHAVTINDVTVTPASRGDVVSLRLSSKQDYRVFTLNNPERLVFDFPSLVWQVPQKQVVPPSASLVSRVRFGHFDTRTSRLVIEMKSKGRIMQIGWQQEASGEAVLTIELTSQSGAPGISAPTPKPVPTEQITGTLTIPHAPPMARPLPEGAGQPAGTSAVPPVGQASREPAQKVSVDAQGRFLVAPVPVLKPEYSMYAKPVIVIDAGHGGEDPGAISGSGTYEKFVTLAYAKAVREALLRTGRYNVVMTREDDRFILLHERVAIGRRARGDLFISLHADSAPNKMARGFSVYTVSDTASDDEAAALAASENKADIISGLDLSAQSPDVADILIDLAQRETKNKSAQFADIMVQQIGNRNVRLLPNPHRFAGFRVLKAPDMPSVLVEIGFLSSPDDEKLINTLEMRQRVSSGIVGAVDAFFALQRKL